MRSGMGFTNIAYEVYELRIWGVACAMDIGRNKSLLLVQYIWYIWKVD